MAMVLIAAALAAAATAPAVAAGTVALERGERLEWTHTASGPHAAVTGPAVAALADGAPLLAWSAAGGDGNALWVLRPADPGARPVRADAPDARVDSLHQPPAIAVGRDGAVFVSWSSVKQKPAGVLFASDLRLARSTDGGRTFGGGLRVNADRPVSHSFDGLAVAGSGTPIVAWVDARDGESRPATWVARVSADASRVESERRLGDDTCVCCRVDVAARGERVAALWRKDFPGHVRDMVAAVSSDGGVAFAAERAVHDDGWVMPGCPHRGGSVAIDAAGRVHAAWYTEGRDGKPELLYARALDGATFAAPRRLDESDGSIPDHVRLAADGGGAVLVVWEDATAVRRRIVARASADGGATFGPVVALSVAMKAYDPALAATPGGGFLVAWTEEQFPATKAIVQRVRVAGGPAPRGESDGPA